MREPIDLDEIDAKLDEVRRNVDHGEAQYNPHALTALRAAEKLLAEVRQLRAELEEYAGDTRHVIELRTLDFTIKHPATCRPNLFDCELGRVTNEIAKVAGPPAKRGRYYCELTEDGKLSIGEPVEPTAAAVSDG